MSHSRESARQQLRQRLESLQRAGVSQLPRLQSLAAAAAPPSPPPVAHAPPVPNTATASTPATPFATMLSLFESSSEPLRSPGPPPTLAEIQTGLAVIAAEIAACNRCTALVENRTRTVPGEGNPQTRLMFIGEAPGADEDRTGRPFVGRAGQLLTDMITKGMGLSREDVYIANTLKCRPPANRVPLPDELASCRGYLDRQLALIRPDFLCLLGKTAALALIDMPPSTTMGALRGRWFDYRGIRTLVTFHPAYLLRNPAAKKDTWEDLKRLMSAMGLAPPARPNA